MNTKQVMQNKKRTIIKVSLAIFAVLLVVIFAVSHIVGEKVEAYVKTELVKYVEERVEGRVVLNNVELTLTGYVAANGLEIYDGNDNPMLKSSAVRVYYKWLDIFGSEAGMATIEEVLIKDCEVFITEKENKELNIDVLLKEDKDSSKENKESPVWNGKITLENCKLNLNTSVPVKTIEEINAKFDFNDKFIDIALNGKVEGINIKTKGAFNKEQKSLEIATLENIKITEENTNTLGLNTDSLKVQHLVLGKMTIALIKNNEDKYDVNASGSFSELNVTGDVEIKNGSGDFAYNNDVLDLNNLSFAILDQNASGFGKVFLAEEDNTKVDFDLSLPQINPADFVQDIQTQGALAADVKITGSVDNPQIGGNFNLPGANVEGFALNNIRGNFGFDINNKKLILNQVNGTNGNGTVSAVGDVFIDNEVIELDISGQGLDPAIVVDPKIKLKGNFGFNGHMSSGVSGAVIKGNFAIEDGSIYDISFQKLSGFFVMKDGKTSLSDLVIKTKFGVIYPEELAADKLNLDKLRGGQVIDSNAIKEGAKESIKESVESEKQKLRDKIGAGLRR